MIRRLTEAQLMQKLGRRFSGVLPDMPDYTTRLSCRYKEWRLARLLSGWPALVEDDFEETEVGLVEEPIFAPYQVAA